ncbi:MAG: hypothetical protein FWG74_08365, partial [Planctomycetes bacterium]|nr:hypothetical protein [Planctomycetota bacterium]
PDPGLAVIFPPVAGLGPDLGDDNLSIFQVALRRIFRSNYGVLAVQEQVRYLERFKFTFARGSGKENQ